MYSGKSDANPNKPMYIGLLVLVGAIAFSVFIYNDLAAWENSNEDKRMHSLLWLLYDMGGKIGVAGFFGLVGVGSFIAGALKTKKLRKIKEETKF